MKFHELRKVTTRLTPKEYERVDEYAERYHKTTGEAIRDLVTTALAWIDSHCPECEGVLQFAYDEEHEVSYNRCPRCEWSEEY